MSTNSESSPEISDEFKHFVFATKSKPKQIELKILKCLATIKDIRNLLKHFQIKFYSVTNSKDEVRCDCKICGKSGIAIWLTNPKSPSFSYACQCKDERGDLIQLIQEFGNMTEREAIIKEIESFSKAEAIKQMRVFS